jgi:pimeloyl-ACP methyl ester carboxylesterase
VSDHGESTFRWLERGEGEPVLFLHGLMGRMDDWDATLDRLSAACRPMALSLPIFEPWLPAPTIEALADHVRAFLDALEIPRLILGGNSLGGHVALRVAMAAPERVSGLVLTGSSGLFERSFTRGVPHRPSEAFVREKMEEIFHDPDLVTPEWVESVRRLGLPPRRPRCGSCASPAPPAATTWRARLHELRAPTLLVWGREDRITPPRGWPSASAASSRLRSSSICPRADTPMLEWPDRFAAAVAWWLRASRERRTVPSAGDRRRPKMARAAARVLDWVGGAASPLARAGVAATRAACRRSSCSGLITVARDTEFGLAHGFAGIRSVAEYQERGAPARLSRLPGDMGARGVGRARRDLAGGGASLGEDVRHHRGRQADPGDARGARRAPAGRVGRAAPRVGARGRGAAAGRPDAVPRRQHHAQAARRAQRGRRSLGTDGATAAAGAPRTLCSGSRGRHRRLGTRVEAIARQVAWQDVRLLAGMPSWMLVLFERVARVRELAGRPIRDMRYCWPDLRIFIHGGVSFGPYASVLAEWLGRPVERLEVYPASEGWVAMQTESEGLTLTLDHHVFYEFVPVEDLGSDRPRRHTVADVELGRPYAVALSTSGGLWSYLLGDTVRFTARDPLRLRIIGRTRHFVNAFGENVIVEEVERALTTACHRSDAEVVEFTVAPRYPSAEEPRGSHEWLVEFRVPPREPEEFARVLDEALAALNTDYRTKRWRDVGMVAPRILTLPPGTFHRWMHGAGKLGDQHRVPRVSNGRELAEALLAAGGMTAPPAVSEAVGSR